MNYLTKSSSGCNVKKSLKMKKHFIIVPITLLFAVIISILVLAFPPKSKASPSALNSETKGQWDVYLTVFLPELKDSCLMSREWEGTPVKLYDTVNVGLVIHPRTKQPSWEYLDSTNSTKWYIIKTYKAVIKDFAKRIPSRF